MLKCQGLLHKQLTNTETPISVNISRLWLYVLSAETSLSIGFISFNVFQLREPHLKTRKWPHTVFAHCIMSNGSPHPWFPPPFSSLTICPVFIPFSFACDIYTRCITCTMVATTQATHPHLLLFPFLHLSSIPFKIRLPFQWDVHMRNLPDISYGNEIPQ